MQERGPWHHWRKERGRGRFVRVYIEHVFFYEMEMDGSHSYQQVDRQTLLPGDFAIDGPTKDTKRGKT